MIHYEKELNPQQIAAVKAEAGPILVIAGAGSGKTRTLTYRVAYLIENGLPPDRLLLLTFTNKAAKEMLRRVSGLMPLDSSRIWGGTFHSVANRILRRHARSLGYESNYAILDREDSKDLVHACIPDAGIDVKEKRFPKADVLVELYSLAVNTERPISEIIAQQYSYFADVTDKVVAVKKFYTERKKRANAMDYDDLLFNLLRLLREHPDAAGIYGRQFLSILVDEYQDTNRIQADIVDRIAAQHQNVMVVGDDAQSIYSWRGANFRNIMEFPKRYPAARIFKIEQNYRSTPQILNLANEAIAGNVHQFEKNLQATRNDGVKPQVVPALNTSEQAAFVATEMLELRDQGIPLNEMAVLYRSHFHSMELQMELTRRNIPFYITSGLRFFEQAHIKDVAAYLKLAVNPDDELAFKRIALMMPKIGAATAAKLWRKLRPDAPSPTADESGGASPPSPDFPLSFSTPPPSSAHATSDSTETPSRAQCADDYLSILENVPKPARKEWKQFAETMTQLRAPDVRNHPSQMIRMALDAGYEDYLKSKFENYPSRKEDIEQLAVYAARFNKTEEFLGELALMTNVESEEGRLEGNQDREVTRLSTVHQAKGQEFRVVFVIWLADGAFPNSRALESVEGEEEERRLFYVAVTRAKDELYLAYPQLRLGGDYGDAFQKPSRFLQELSKKCYEKRELESRY
ncbi:MAG: ATP-dependent helicase [Verrucomicrobia bacterium]|nr:ATP-dependent helicase [Verrucomicrobiota bacterium]